MGNGSMLDYLKKERDSLELDADNSDIARSGKFSLNIWASDFNISPLYFELDLCFYHEL